MGSGARPNVVLFDGAAARAQRVLDELREHGLRAERVDLTAGEPGEIPHGIDVAMFVFDMQATTPDKARVESLIERLSAEQIETIVWGETSEPEKLGAQVQQLAADTSLGEVIGRLETVARYAPMVRRLDRELRHLQRLSKQINRYFDDVDKEMRLAGRLQKDFMPRKLPEVPPLRFAHLFRPASWVSGDIYDVFKIDDHHAGMFIADAMGHGTAAGLMTMFLRRALVARRVEGGAYRIVTPPEAMCDLHSELARLELPNFQFITSAYAVIDTESLECRIARGGHPYPIHVDAAGELSTLRPEGGLLGLADLEPEFDECAVTLAPGEKIIFYTDGFEDVLNDQAKADGQANGLMHMMGRWSQHDAAGLIDAIADYLDHVEGSLHPDDDITVLVMEVQRC